MKKEDFYFDLPEELIGQTPIKNRENSRLLILDKKSGDIEHGVFSDILNNFNKGDCLVLNNTRVIPARLFGHKKYTGSSVEFLLLKRIDSNRWETLVKPGKKAKPGSIFDFGQGLMEGQILEVQEGGTRIIEFKYDGVFEHILDKLGEMPLPPYIREKLEDKERYQTVYSKREGSAAAPTAGLHFTKSLLQRIEEKGVSIVYITLHVGLGTFRPVKAENIEEHDMHHEYYEIDENSAKIINDTKKAGGNIIAVGTTSVRTLESASNEQGQVLAKNGWTNIFIYPGYKYRIIDRLITNFHLPESTLIMLVSALAGREKVLRAYDEAIKLRYRFFSFGDAMFIK
ncbi:MAG: tRNA preQ1(34) S-adenosylmethionine ribosyltransferase-isomerase QueA [Tissierellales bacterium]